MEDIIKLVSSMTDVETVEIEFITNGFVITAHGYNDRIRIVANNFDEVVEVLRELNGNK